MKYDFAVDFSAENVWSITAKQIKQGSTVLEFGPASGYFTKHLKESLNCKVYIVELDEESFQHAKAYAVDGICEDIEEYQWVKRFNGIQFDHIVFLDVLEHLRHPENVLKESMRFLADQGTVLFSIPNIAHNTVLVNLFNNKFEYTPLGLLDDTHIRFFTYYQVVEMLDRLGLYASRMQAINRHLGESEIENSYKDLPADCVRWFKQRKFGNIYQFLFECKRADESAEKPVADNQMEIIGKNYVSRLYVKDHLYLQDLTGNERHLEYIVNERDSNELKLDLCDASSAFIKINSVKINGIRYDNFETNAFWAQNGVYYYDELPLIHVVMERLYLKKVVVDLEYRMMDNDLLQLRELISVIQDIAVARQDLDMRLQQREQEIGKLSDTLEQILRSRTYRFARFLLKIKQKLFREG